jgi:hypothetical protein
MVEHYVQVPLPISIPVFFFPQVTFPFYPEGGSIGFLKTPGNVLPDYISYCQKKVFRPPPAYVSQKSSVGIATPYGLDRPGSIPGSVKFFSIASTPTFWDMPSLQWLSEGILPWGRG